MPLHGKIVVIKRSGADGTEFPLTATCLFGRKPDCDIRIQLPQVSKEHCRIDLNENKEVILTNMSSVNPTRVNGEILQQSERLKHGDVITIIDRSFRFEYPPAPTPKKRSSTGGKTKTLKVLQDPQVVDTVIPEPGEKRVSEVFTDGNRHDNVQQLLENTVEVESKEGDSLLQNKNKTNSPFNDLYQMIKKSLDVKTPRKSSVSLLQTPMSRFCTPKPGSVKKNDKPVTFPEARNSPMTEAKVLSGADETKAEVESVANGTPKSVKKQGMSFQFSIENPAVEEADHAKSEAFSPQRRYHATPQRFTVHEVIEQVCVRNPPKSPLRRKSKEATAAKTSVTQEKEISAPSPPQPQRVSPRNSAKAENVKEMPKKRKSSELGADLPSSQMKRKRVSFGGYLSPELFDKRLPPDSPLRKGAAPRRSLCLHKPKQSLLRRASVIGLQMEQNDLKANKGTPSPKKSSNNQNATPTSAKKSPKSRSPSPQAASPGKMSPSPKAASPGKKSPKSRSPSSKAASPGKKSPKSRSPSPKAASPGKKSPKSRSPSSKAASPGKKSPKSRSPSPKAASPGKKSPKSRSPSSKAASPGKKSPKSRSPSPKAASPGKKSPKSKSPSPNTASPGKKSPRSPSPKPDKKHPKSKSPSAKGSSYENPKSKSPISMTPLKRGKSPSNKFETPKAQKKSTALVLVPYKETSTSKKENAFTVITPGKTPTVQGRFSVSRISTPSPVAEDVSDLVPLVTVTPKIPLSRKSMKSTKQKTPSIVKSAAKIMRRSGISRASMKFKNSWADIVKYGRIKAQVAAPAKKTVIKKTKKAAVPKIQTPARKLQNHVSTGHANSPVTIVVGRAHKQRVLQTTGAAPKVVVNTALLKKNMKMDEDLTGISEMFKTPVNERKTKSVISGSVTETPVGVVGTLVVEPSVLNTPEEPGEMMVSPLSVASTVKSRSYNSEAVQRLLNGDQDSSFVSEIPDLETPSESSEQQSIEVMTTTITTPKQKPEQLACLTGVKRIMKTPRRKAEPVDDLRGKILKTPKQKPEQKECLTGIKRIMKTPRQKGEPVEELRGKLLATPKQKPEQQECLSGVKRMLKTPRQKAKPIEDIRGNLLVTPKQKLEIQESLSGVKRIYSTPQQEAKAVEDCQGKLANTPRALDAHGVSLIGSDISDMENTMNLDVKSHSMECLTDVKRIVKMPKEKNAPVEDMVGLKRLMKTPRQKAEPVEDNFGIKRLMKSPRLRGNAPVEDFEGLQELMEESLPDLSGQEEMNELTEDQMSPVCVMVKEVDFACKEPQSNAPEASGNTSHFSVSKEAVDVPNGDDGQSSNTMKIISHTAIDSFEEPPKVDAVVKNLSDDEPEMEVTTGKGAEMEARVESEVAANKKETTEQPEDLVAPAPLRGRRAKKTEAAAPNRVRQTRNKNAKSTDGNNADVTVKENAPQPSKVAVKPKRGRRAKTASDDQAEMLPEAATETEAESKQISSADVNLTVNDGEAPEDKPVSNPKRGRKTKQPEATQSGPEKQVDCCAPSDGVSQSGMDKVAPEVCTDLLEIIPTRVDENLQSANVKETVLHTHVTKSLLEVGTEATAAIIQKTSLRGRKAKLPESKQEETDHSEEPVVTAPVRGRRGKKNEAAAPPAVRQTRTRNAKSKEGTCDDKPEIAPEICVEPQPMTEMSPEGALVNNNQNETESPAEEAAVKPIRGRKAKQTPVETSQPEMEKTEVMTDEQIMAEPPQPIPFAAKSSRGRKAKPDTVEKNEVTEVTAVTVETKQVSQLPARAKRGRNAKLEEEKKAMESNTTSGETSNAQKPVKKLRKTKKVEKDNVDSLSEEIQTIEMVIPLEVETSEPHEMSEQVPVTAKPKRGRKVEQCTESEATEDHKVLIHKSTEKPKRGRRGKETVEVDVVTVHAPVGESENLPEAQDKSTEPDAPVIKTPRGRGVKTSVRGESSQVVPAKRVRRGAATPLEDVNTEPVQISSVPKSVKPVQRGRRAPSAKPTSDETQVSSDQAIPGNGEAGGDAKMTKRSVRWKSESEVFQIPKITPVKPTRGRKSKLVEQVEAESKIDNRTKKNLSDEVVEAQPSKRARRGAKVAELESSSTVEPQKGAEVETQLKTRRGRPVKK